MECNLDIADQFSLLRFNQVRSSSVDSLIQLLRCNISARTGCDDQSKRHTTITCAHSWSFDRA